MRTRGSALTAAAGCLLLMWAAAAPAGAGTVGAVTPYPVTGATPVTGSLKGCDDAPVLEPGRYVDALGDRSDVWYRIEKRPDQAVEVSATAVAAGLTSDSPVIGIGMGWAEGNEPKSWLEDLDYESGTGLASVGGRSNAKADGQRYGCIRIDNRLNLKSKDKPVPLELVLRFGDSPPIPTTTDGFSFLGATPVPPSGSARDDLSLGEFPFWRVEVQDGQTLTVDTVLTHPASLDAGQIARWTVRIYNPYRSAVRCPAKSGGSSEAFIKAGTASTTQSCGPWTVDTLAKSYESEFTVPGTYYIVPGAITVNDAARAQVAPYELKVSVTGTARPPASGSGSGSGSGKEPAGSGGSGGSAGAAGSGDAGDQQPAGSASAAGGGGDSIDAVLKAVAGASALVAVGAYGMHLRRRRIDGQPAVAGLAVAGGPWQTGMPPMPGAAAGSMPPMSGGPKSGAAYSGSPSPAAPGSLSHGSVPHGSGVSGSGAPVSGSPVVASPVPASPMPVPPAPVPPGSASPVTGTSAPAAPAAPQTAMPPAFAAPVPSSGPRSIPPSIPPAGRSTNPWGMAPPSAPAAPAPAGPIPAAPQPSASPEPPDHNALDSVWSLSAIPAGTADDDDPEATTATGFFTYEDEPEPDEVPDTTAGHPAVPGPDAEGPEAITPDPPSNLPTWRPPGPSSAD